MLLSIGRFAKLAQVSPRTLRHYESLGLIAATSRGDNHYRYYDDELLDRLIRIRNLQTLGFSLDEIQKVIKVADTDLVADFQKKLAEVESDLSTLTDRRAHLQKLLSVANRIGLNEPINAKERAQFMESIQSEFVQGLVARCGTLSEQHRKYLKRDLGLYQSPERQEIFDAIKKCVEFARSRRLKLGPGRGSSPASLGLYSLGFISVDPSRYDLIPERLESTDWNIHIDVEYERGLEFVEYCQEISSHLKHGQIQAFRMPLIDIIENVHKRLGIEINYSAIPDDSVEILNTFRSGDIEKIFLFDSSPETLLARVFADPPEYRGTTKISEYLRSQRIHNFRDIMNIIAVWRPSTLNGMPERIERYRQAKTKPFRYEFLTDKLQESLKPNFGLALYHEDLIRILKEYTPWSLERCNRLRMGILKNDPAIAQQISELKKLAPSKVVKLVEKESRQTFCFPHVVAFSQFTKQTAFLMSHHRDTYLGEIQRFESKHPLRWDDIGIRTQGISLLQQ